MGSVCSKDPQSRVMGLVPALDVSLEGAEHPVQLGLFLLVELTSHPGESREDRVGEPVTPDLRHASLLQRRVHKVVQQLEEGPGRDDVTVDQVGDELTKYLASSHLELLRQSFRDRMRISTHSPPKL